MMRVYFDNAINNTSVHSITVCYYFRLVQIAVIVLVDHVNNALMWFLDSYKYVFVQDLLWIWKIRLDEHIAIYRV